MQIIRPGDSSWNIIPKGVYRGIVLRGFRVGGINLFMGVDLGPDIEIMSGGKIKLSGQSLLLLPLNCRDEKYIVTYSIALHLIFIHFGGNVFFDGSKDSLRFVFNQSDPFQLSDSYGYEMVSPEFEGLGTLNRIGFYCKPLITRAVYVFKNVSKLLKGGASYVSPGVRSLVIKDDFGIRRYSPNTLWTIQNRDTGFVLLDRFSRKVEVTVLYDGVTNVVNSNGFSVVGELVSKLEE